MRHSIGMTAGGMIYTKFRNDRFRQLSNITVITAKIWKAVMLVLLI
jgi:hypothetical protein